MRNKISKDKIKPNRRHAKSHKIGKYKSMELQKVTKVAKDKVII